MQQPNTIIALSLSFALLGITACVDPETVHEDQLRDGETGGDTEPDPPTPVSAKELVGLHLDDLELMAPNTVEYKMNPYPSDPLFNSSEIQDPEAGWPAHGLQWKDAASGFNHNFAIDEAHTQISSVPFFGWYVWPGDDDELNTLEANSAVFSSDPNGTWMEINITDPAVGLVYAALVMHFWNSPVYVDATHNYPSGGYAHGSFSHTIALQKLRFTLPSATDLLTACGLPSNASPSAALNASLQCTHGTLLSSDEVSLWNDYLCPGCPNGTYVPYDRQVALPANELVTAWWLSAGNQGQMVFDPPGGATGEDLAGIEVLAEALADQILVADEDGYLMLLRDYVEKLEG